MDAHVMVEVLGCPTTCMHCWALGRSYRPMPIEDAAFLLDELSGFCGERDLVTSCVHWTRMAAPNAGAGAGSTWSARSAQREDGRR